jgi:hypothetical protein
MKLDNRNANSRNAAPRISAVARFLSLTFILLAPTLHATIPEPDNLLYGNITLDNTPVTAARTDVVVEARRTADGPAVARYRMGSDPGAGGFYLLRIPIESLAQDASPNAAQPGESLFLVVTDASGVRAQTTHTVEDRGQVLRVDFGPAIPDTDGNGLPDLWELTHFGAVGQDPNAVLANGQTTWQNFLAGTNPNDPDDVFRLNISRDGSERRVSFLARRAEGPGYDGTTRLYTLESNQNLTGDAWNHVPDFVDLPGQNQTVVHFAAASAAPSYFRGRIVLAGAIEPPTVPGDEVLPDDWKLLHFGTTNVAPDMVTANGQTALHNYIAGTDPNDPNSLFLLNVSSAGASTEVSFHALRAHGTGYDGRTRHYSLESASAPGGSWQTVPGFSDLVGNDLTVRFESLTTDAPRFFRVNVRLTGP